MSDAPTISVLIIARDEEERIGDAIRSCRPFADEVVVVDGGSTDSTVALARSLGADVDVHEWRGFAAQRRHALSRARCGWVFFIDADEVVGEHLAGAIREAVRREGGPDGYEVIRVGDFFGQWVGGDRQLRLCRRAAATIHDAEVHERLEVDGEVGELDGVLWHLGFRSVQDHVHRFNRYTDLEARQAVADGRSFSLVRLLTRPPAHFALVYFGRGLARRGVAGLAVATFWAVYDLLVELKLYEAGWRQRDARHRPASAEAEVVERGRATRW